MRTILDEHSKMFQIGFQQNDYSDSKDPEKELIQKYVQSTLGDKIRHKSLPKKRSKYEFKEMQNMTDSKAQRFYSNYNYA